MTRYRTIVADPPWHYPHGHPARVHLKHPYPTMTLGELCALPVHDLADQSAHLYLWTTNEHLRYAFAVVGAWGFTFKNVLVWAKPGLGMGGTFRNAHELVLVGERGKCEFKRRDVGTWHKWPNPKANSAKPEAFIDLVESVSHGPYLELFARHKARFGWDYWGNEALQTVEMPEVEIPEPDDDVVQGPTRQGADRVKACAFCGGYGAANEETHEPVPCLACGKKSEGMVLMALNPSGDGLPSNSQHLGLHLVKEETKAATTFAPNRSGASAASGDPVARETTPPTPPSEQGRRTL
jgi:N6-adenosine-specific RNA methylase IME4